MVAADAALLASTPVRKSRREYRQDIKRALRVLSAEPVELAFSGWSLIALHEYGNWLRTTCYIPHTVAATPRNGSPLGTVERERTGSSY
jgi:hypothetical protein